jgi:hypothetical protein
MANPSMVEVTVALDTYHQLDMFKFVSTLSPAWTMGSAGVPSAAGAQDPARLSKVVVLKRSGVVSEAFYSTQVAGVLPISGQEVKLW